MRLIRTPVPPKHASLSNTDLPIEVKRNRNKLITCLLQNNISEADLAILRSGDESTGGDEADNGITPEELSIIIQRIYDLNEKYILDLSTVDGLLRTFNQFKNAKRNKRFDKKIRKSFRQLNDGAKKIILAEGDSWFNYPVILTDIIDRISMEKNFALYSLAAGGDWFLNMLSGRQYVEELSLLHPNVFLISGGGNDLVGSRRLAAILDPSGNSKEFAANQWANRLISDAKDREAKKTYTPLNEDTFNEGCKYLSKDFFALLMFFHLQYYSLIDGIVGSNKKATKFPGIKIITQGYDYPIPSFSKSFGFNPMLWYVPFIRTFLGHGAWLKHPMQLRGINESSTQKSILYAMIYLFNEMMIDIGNFFEQRGQHQVFHIDSRNTVGDDGWTDELHARPDRQMKIGETFIKCINDGECTYGNVFVVTPFKPSQL